MSSPGLFEGDEHTTLMTQCKEGAQREGHMLDSNEELYKWFTHQVRIIRFIGFTYNTRSYTRGSHTRLGSLDL